MDLNQLSKEIIEKNQYLALSTTDEKRNPWTCVLAYTFDKSYNFYFVSLPSSKHSRNIEKSRHVSFAIYDSTQGFGLGTGLQIQAKASELEPTQTPVATKLYFERKYPYGNLSNSFTTSLKQLIKSGVYKFYKLAPIKIWINDPNADTDKRVEVKPQFFK